MELPATYKKIRKIGEGAFTSVILVEDVTTGDKFAIKKIRSKAILKVTQDHQDRRSQGTKNPATYLPSPNS